MFDAIAAIERHKFDFQISIALSFFASHKRWRHLRIYLREWSTYCTVRLFCNIVLRLWSRPDATRKQRRAIIRQRWRHNYCSAYCNSVPPNKRDVAQSLIHRDSQLSYCWRPTMMANSHFLLASSTVMIVYSDIMVKPRSQPKGIIRQRSSNLVHTGVVYFWT